MIKAGDLVRFSNEYLRSIHIRMNKKGKTFRRKNRVMRVVKIVYTNDQQVRLDPRMGFNAVVRLDVTNIEVYGNMKFKDPKENVQISTSWLKFVRRKKAQIEPALSSARNLFNQRVYPLEVMEQIVTVTPMMIQAVMEEQAQRDSAKVQRFAAPLGQRSLDL